MASHYDPNRSCVLQVTITHLKYSVTEKVLGQLFGVYGVNEVCLLRQPTHLEVFVEFQSWYEASQARDALHGRCIYDGSCLLDIQHAPPSISVHRLPNSEPVVVDWDRVEMADHVEVEPLVSAPTPPASTPASASAAITSMAVCEVSTKVHSDAVGPIVDKALDSEEVIALPTAPHNTASSTTTDVKKAHEVEDVFPACTGCITLAPTSCSALCLHDNYDKLLCTCLGASRVPRPLPWPSFMCDRGGDSLAFPWPAPQGTFTRSSTAIVVMNCFPDEVLANEAPLRKLQYDQPTLTWTPPIGHATMLRKFDARDEWLNSPWDPGKGIKYYVLFVQCTLVRGNPKMQGTIQSLKIFALGRFLGTTKLKGNDTWTIRCFQHGSELATISVLFNSSCCYTSVPALLSQWSGSLEHLSFSDYRNLRGSSCKGTSPELPLYGNDGFMGHSVLELVVQTKWDPSLRLATPCEEQWVLHQVTCTATTLWDPGIAVLNLILVPLATVSTSEFETWKLQQTLKADTVRYYCHAVQEYGSIALVDPHQEFYPWRSELIAPFVLLTKSELVLQGIHRCQDFYPLTILASKLQYRPWDPGVHSAVLAVLIKVTAAGARDACDRASCLPRLQCNRAKKYCNKLLCFLHTTLPDHAFAKLLIFWSRVLSFILLVSHLAPGQGHVTPHVLGTPDGQVFLQGKGFAPLQFTRTTKAISMAYWWHAVHGMPSLQGYNGLFFLFILTAHIRLNLQSNLLPRNTVILHGFSQTYKYEQSSFAIRHKYLLTLLALELHKGSTGLEVHLYHQIIQVIGLAHLPPSNYHLRWTACCWIAESCIASVDAYGKYLLQLLLELDNSEHLFHGVWSIFTQTSISRMDAGQVLVCQEDIFGTYCIQGDLLFRCAPTSTCCLLAQSVCVCQEDMLETLYCQEYITQYYSVESVSLLSVQSVGLGIIPGCLHSALLGQLFLDHYHSTPVKTSLLLQYELLWRQHGIVLEDKQILKRGRVSCPGSMTGMSMCRCVDSMYRSGAQRAVCVPNCFKGQNLYASGDMERNE